MTVFYLVDSKQERRRILTPVRPCRPESILREIEAESWKAAKAVVDGEARPALTLETLFTREPSPSLPPSDAPFPA